MARVTLKHLSRSFGPVAAVRDLSLEIPDGTLLCLLGPSGSGKTTTLRLVAGLERPDSGEIWLDDDEISRLEPKDRHVGVMFQGYALYPQMSVRDNIGYPLKVRGVPRPERAARVAEVARLLEIDSLLDRAVQQISGGQQQRVALARAIIQRPRLFLLDEPISNLDAVLRSTMRAEIRRLQKMLGATTIVVSHDQLDALAMADLIAIMKDGVIQQLGTPDDVYYRPSNTFVARFIGEPQMNLLPARLARGERGLGVHVLGHWLPVTETARAALAAVTLPDVVVGVRPRAVRIHHEAGDDRIAATVYLAAPEGSRIIYQFQIGGDRLTVEAEPEFRLNEGEEVHLELRPESLHFFAPGADGGTRIA